MHLSMNGIPTNEFVPTPPPGRLYSQVTHVYSGRWTWQPCRRPLFRALEDRRTISGGPSRQRGSLVPIRGPPGAESHPRRRASVTKSEREGARDYAADLSLVRMSLGAPVRFQSGQFAHRTQSRESLTSTKTPVVSTGTHDCGNACRRVVCIPKAGGAPAPPRTRPQSLEHEIGRRPESADEPGGRPVGAGRFRIFVFSLDPPIGDPSR